METKVTYEEFIMYERVRKSGIVNMLDRNGVYLLSGGIVNSDVHKECVLHYAELEEKYHVRGIEFEKLEAEDVKRVMKELNPEDRRMARQYLKA